MLKEMHKDQEKSSVERLDVLKELNANIKILIDKLWKTETTPDVNHCPSISTHNLI